ncbi:MAG TPA: inorganic phosphate transporter [Symbiobacteriaceae bacterium]
MLEPQWLIILVVICGLIFDFTNGWNDAANAIATVVATRVLTPIQAVAMAAFFNVVGAFISTKVAHTVGEGLLDPSQVNQTLVLAALVAGITWNVIMTLMGLPISASHALVGGMVGAAVAKGGWGIVQFGGITTVLVAMLLSPLLGGLFGYLLMKLIHLLVGNWPPTRVTHWFRRLQLISVAAVSFNHGSGDAQKVMGIVTLALLAGGFIPEFKVPIWVVFAAAMAMGLGTLAGGWGVIKTIGMKMAKLQPVHGFAAETGAALFLALANFVEGVPVSSTHTLTGSIIGVGLARRAKSVRWMVASKIIYAWVFTLPGCALVGWVMYRLLSLLV